MGRRPARTTTALVTQMPLAEMILALEEMQVLSERLSRSSDRK